MSYTKGSSSAPAHPNKSQAWKVAFIGYLTSFMLSVKSALGLIPEPFYPNNPKDKGFFGKLNTQWGLKISSALFFLGTLFSITDTWGAIKDFYYDNEKNWKKALVLTIRILLSLSLITLFTLAKIGTAVLVFKFLPYILITAVGLKAVYHLGRCVYELYQFAKTWKTEHLIAAGVELAKIVGYALGLAALILFSIKINQDFMQLNSNLLNDLLVMRKVGDVYGAMQGLVFTCCAVLTCAMIPEFYERAKQMNQETLEYLKHPIKNLITTIKEKAQAFSDFYKAHPYAAVVLAIPILVLDGVKMISTAVLRLAALPLYPVIISMQQFAKGVRQVAHWIWQKLHPKTKQEVQPEAESPRPVHDASAVSSATTSPSCSRSQDSTPTTVVRSPSPPSPTAASLTIGFFASRSDPIPCSPQGNPKLQGRFFNDAWILDPRCSHRNGETENGSSPNNVI